MVINRADEKDKLQQNMVNAILTSTASDLDIESLDDNLENTSFHTK